MDALYVFKHSQFGDEEIRYSLRSVNQYLPYIRKVWILGDCPSFVSDDRLLIQHVSHEEVAWVGRYNVPVRNTFLMLFLASLIPELDSEFLWFCDDFLLIDYLSEIDAKQARYVEDMEKVANRGQGLFKDALWRTYDVLRRLGYYGWNFETHVATYFTKRWVLDAFKDLQDYVSEDRFYGLIGPTAILNHALKENPRRLIHLASEGRRAGFHGKPASYEVIAELCSGRTFLNFDDDGYGNGMRRYLAERFPTPCIYEKP